MKTDASTIVVLDMRSNLIWFSVKLILAVGFCEYMAGTYFGSTGWYFALGAILTVMEFTRMQNSFEYAFDPHAQGWRNRLGKSKSDLSEADALNRSPFWSWGLILVLLALAGAFDYFGDARSLISHYF